MRPGTDYDERHFVEELGLLFSSSGKPRMMGRMMAWLLVCDPPWQSAGQLVEALQASKATVSTTSRDLIEQGMVERVARPGDRKTYYRARPGGFARLAERELDAVSGFSAALCRALEHMEEHAPERTERLAEVHDLYRFLEREIPALLTRWAEGRRTP
jgi:DNA-binding transcriptional regulator GbsR (MarR family)